MELLFCELRQPSDYSIDSSLFTYYLISLLILLLGNTCACELCTGNRRRSSNITAIAR
jgi:hypothetical protein